jgi:hypothetical protein
MTPTNVLAFLCADAGEVLRNVFALLARLTQLRATTRSVRIAVTDRGARRPMARSNTTLGSPPFMPWSADATPHTKHRVKSTTCKMTPTTWGKSLIWQSDLPAPESRFFAYRRHARTQA